MARNRNSVVKIFKIFENLLGEFGLELGHLGFIIRNYYIRVSIELACEGLRERLRVAVLPLIGLAVAVLPLIGLAVAVCLRKKGLGLPCWVRLRSGCGS